MDAKNSLGSILRRLRREKRKKTIEAAQWTQDAVAKRIGVSRVAYIAWESDEYLPDAQHTKRIIEVFRPSEKDEFALYRAVGQRPPEQQNLPDRNALFTGREDYLDELYRKLLEGRNVTITQAVGISGFGGIGKSQIALEYAHQYHPDEYRTALWANAADQTTLQADYDAIARLLDLPECDEQDADLRVEAVKRWLDEHTRWLLILDNADDLQLVRSFMPGRRLGHIILTTRAQAIRESNIAVQLVVDEMKLREALIFLLRRAGLWDEESDLDNETKLAAVAPKTRECATELVALLGNHPLAIDQAGAYIEATGMLIADYIQLYRAERQKLLDTRGPPRKDVYEDHPESVTVTVSLSFEKACRRDAKVADVLFYCLFLQPDTICEEFFYQDSDMQLTLGAFNDTMAALRQYSLVNKRIAYAKLFSIHRLVQSVLSDYLSDEQKEQWEERVVHTLNAAFPEVVRFDNLRRCQQLIPHALTHANSVIDGEISAAQETAELITKAAAYIQEGGLFVVAKQLLLWVHKFWEQRLGKEHLTTAAAAHRLGQHYKKRGFHDEAKIHLMAALAVYESHLGLYHLNTASVLSDLGVVYAAQRRYKSALLVLTMTIAIQSRWLGEHHSLTICSMRDMATVLRLIGRYDLALRMYKEALSDAEKNCSYAEDNLGKGLASDFPDLPDLLSITREMGMTYTMIGDYERAERNLSLVGDYCERYFGPEHPYTLKNVAYRAWLFYKQGKYELSKELYLFLLGPRKLREKIDFIELALAYYGLALIWHEEKKYDWAETLYRRVMEIYDKVAGGPAGYPPDLIKHYAALLSEVNRYAEAEAEEAHALPPYDWDKDEGDRELDGYFMQYLIGGKGRHNQGLPERAVKDPFTKVRFGPEQVPSIENELLEGILTIL